MIDWAKHEDAINLVEQDWVKRGILNDLLGAVRVEPTKIQVARDFVARQTEKFASRIKFHVDPSGEFALIGTDVDFLRTAARRLVKGIPEYSKNAASEAFVGVAEPSPKLPETIPTGQTPVSLKAAVFPPTVH